MASTERARTATIASRVFEPEGTAAAYRLGALARALREAGYVTTVLTSRPPAPVERVRGVRRWPVLRDRTGAVRGYLQYASFDIPLFFRLLFGPRADAVVVEPPPTTGFVARIACWLRRTPYVYFSADVSSTAAEGIGVSPRVVRVVRAIESWVLRGARGVLAVSPEVRGEVIQLGATADRVAMVGTGIDTSSFGPTGPTADVDYPYFIYAGTMSEIQGAGVFVDAFTKVAAKHPTVRLKLFGSGVEFDQLRERAAVTDRIELRGLIGAEELSPWLRGAAAGLASVRPGCGYDFAFATKALVSLSSGTPVVYAGVGPLAELVTKNNLGLAVDWDAAAVATAMDAVLAGRASTLGHAELSRWVADNYSLDAVAQRCVAAITRAIDG